MLKDQTRLSLIGTVRWVPAGPREMMTSTLERTAGWKAEFRWLGR